MHTYKTEHTYPLQHRLPASIQQKLGALLMFLVWRCWPKVSSGKKFDNTHLLILSNAMDRFHENKYVAYGYGSNVSTPPVFTGQIDVHVHRPKEPLLIQYWAEKWRKRTY